MYEFYTWPWAIGLIITVIFVLFLFVNNRTNLLRYKEIRANLSALSVRNAIDSLHTGVMFYKRNGYIILANTRMQQLMRAIVGKVMGNGRKFYDMLTLGYINPGCLITWFEGQNVILLPDDTAWMLTMAELMIRRRRYTQLTATDVSERWRLTAEMQRQNEQLLRRQTELSQLIDNLHNISRKKEIQTAKLRAHDILGERLTLLLRAIRNEQPPDYSAIRSLAQGLICELKGARNTPSPWDELNILRQTFESIGVETVFNGNLPADNVKGQLIADIAREAVTNAVRHGFASQINFHMDELDGNFRLVIKDNGHPPTGAFKEGVGISGMREKIKPIGGTLDITVDPHFQLTLVLPNCPD